jgi:hypothetical protein
MAWKRVPEGFMLWKGKGLEFEKLGSLHDACSPNYFFLCKYITKSCLSFLTCKIRVTKPIF